MLHIYLDQNKWVDLSRAHHGAPGGEEYVEVLGAARRAVQDGLARFPLSLAHYMETWNQHDAGRRERLTDTMLSLAVSPGHDSPDTIAGPYEIVKMELESCFVRRLGQAAPHREVFGKGAYHVFNDPSFEPTEVPVPDGFPVEMMSIVDDLRRLHRQALDRATLGGPPVDFPVAGIDNESYFNLSNVYLQRQYDVRDVFDSLSMSKAQCRETLAGIIVKDILDIVALVMAERNASREDARLAEPGGALNLVLELPSQELLLETMARSFDNSQFKRGRGDMHDLTVTTTAAVYCNVVVMEKQWGTVMKQTRLDQKHRTTILLDVRDLLPILEAAAVEDVHRTR